MLPGVVSSRSPRARSRSRTPAPAASLRRAPASRCRAAGTFFFFNNVLLVLQGEFSRGFHVGSARFPPRSTATPPPRRRKWSPRSAQDTDNRRRWRWRRAPGLASSRPGAGGGRRADGSCRPGQGKKSASTRKQRRYSLDPPAGPGRPSPGKIKHSLAAFNPDRPHAAHLAAAGRTPAHMHAPVVPWWRLATAGGAHRPRHRIGPPLAASRCQ